MFYYYSKPNRMVGHEFSDDVAVCVALNRKSALNKFKKLYFDCDIKDIHKIRVQNLVSSAVVLTDY